MRLGAYPCVLSPESHTYRAYLQSEISERHRHRYEFNREYEKTFVASGLKIVGVSPDNNFVEVIEIEDHPWFVGCQFHPEFKSKPLTSHPLFKAFIQAAYANQRLRLRKAAVEPVGTSPESRMGAEVHIRSGERAAIPGTQIAQKP